MRTRSFPAVVALLLLPVVPVWAKISCKPFHCPTAAPVEAARAIVERDCPCAAQTSAKQYKRCAKKALKTARQEIGASLTGACLKDVRAAIAESACGRSGTVPCNKRNKKNTRTSCAIVAATKCDGSACGAFTSCADACNPAGQACPLPPTTTTTVVGGGGTSSTSTTTTLPAAYSCSFTTATCTTTACGCPSPGTDYHLGASGSVSGPVGTSLRVNINAPQGGTIDCGGWTRVYGATITGCDTIGCCLHETGAPDTVTWTVSEAIDLPCFCPAAPDPSQVLHNYVVQCQLPPGAVVEHFQTTAPCS